MTCRISHFQDGGSFQLNPLVTTCRLGILHRIVTNQIHRYKQILSKLKRTRSQKNIWFGHFKLEDFICRHVVYVPKSATAFRGILICVIFRPSDMQEYILMFSMEITVLYFKLCGRKSWLNICNYPFTQLRYASLAKLILLP
jgi:hypothetical protein